MLELFRPQTSTRSREKDNVHFECPTADISEFRPVALRMAGNRLVWRLRAKTLPPPLSAFKSSSLDRAIFFVTKQDNPNTCASPISTPDV